MPDVSEKTEYHLTPLDNFNKIHWVTCMHTHISRPMPCPPHTHNVSHRVFLSTLRERNRKTHTERGGESKRERESEREREREIREIC